MLLHPVSAGPESRRSAVAVMLFCASVWPLFFGLAVSAFGDSWHGLWFAIAALDLWALGLRLLSPARPGLRRP